MVEELELRLLGNLEREMQLVCHRTSAFRTKGMLPE